MGLAAIAVDPDLTQLARLLGLGTRFVHTGHVEPDIEPNRFVVVHGLHGTRLRVKG
jgi:hypothetical protein